MFMLDNKPKNNNGDDEKNNNNGEEFDFGPESEEFQKGITPPKKDDK